MTTLTVPPACGTTGGMRRGWRILCILGFGLVGAGAREVQGHGVEFERWLRETFFDGYVPEGYTQKWDIPASANPEHGKVPVNPKAAKFGSPVDFGDALRQFAIVAQQERFLLIVGFWKQVSPEQKRWVNVQTVEVVPEQWAKLWGPITLADLKRLDAVVKDAGLSITEARAKAKALKAQLPFTKAIMQVNPKIDAQQRRLQCSLRFADFFRYLAPEAAAVEQAQPKVFGVALPEDFASAPRMRK